MQARTLLQLLKWLEVDQIVAAFLLQHRDRTIVLNSEPGKVMHALNFSENLYDALSFLSR